MIGIITLYHSLISQLNQQVKYVVEFSLLVHEKFDFPALCYDFSYRLPTHWIVLFHASSARSTSKSRMYECFVIRHYITLRHLTLQPVL